MDNPQGTGPTGPANLETSFNAAIDSAGGFPAPPEPVIEQPVAQQTPQSEEAKPEAASASTEEQARDPEHIAWLKSIQGFTDEKGEVKTDHALKQFHEL